MHGLEDLQYDRQQALTALADANPTVAEILEACPFDDSKNIGGTMTAPLFYDLLLAQPEDFYTKISDLETLLHSGVKNSRIVMLSGFPGTGKTTFIRYYLYSRQAHRQVYIDFGKCPTTDKPHPIVHALRAYLRRNLITEGRAPMRTVQSTLALVAKCVDALGDFREDPLVRRYLDLMDEGTPPQSATWFVDLVNQMEPRRLLRLFFLTMFYQIDTERKAGKTGTSSYLICMDNLDAVNLDHLSNELGDYFLPSLVEADSLAQDPLLWSAPINFRRDFRFILALREANYARMNPHLYMRVSGDISKLDFRLHPHQLTHLEIMEKRVSLLEVLRNEHNKYQSAEESQMVQGAATVIRVLSRFASDSYFKSALSNLVNGDMRRMIMILEHISQDEKHRQLMERAATADEGSKVYGARGAILHFVLQELYRSEFLYKWVWRVPTFHRDKGLMYPGRLILATLINITDYNVDRIDSSTESQKAVTWRSLLGALRCPDLFKTDQIVETLGNLFPPKDQDQVHLITLVNASDRTLSREQLLENLRVSNERDQHDDECSFRVTPAGFALVKYILPHFEYYGLLSDVRTAGEEGSSLPLFLMPTRGFQLNQSKNFFFDERIRSVFKIVREHVVAIRRYYVSSVRTTLGMDHTAYRESCLVFRHLQGASKPLRRGWPHVVRVITAHIDYLDRFRTHLLRDPSLVDRRDELAVAVNLRLLGYIRDYVELLLNDCADPAVAKRFVPLRSIVSRLIARPDDFNQRIHLDGHEETSSDDIPPEE